MRSATFTDRRLVDFGRQQFKHSFDRHASANVRLNILHCLYCCLHPYFSLKNRWQTLVAEVQTQVLMQTKNPAYITPTEARKTQNKKDKDQ